MQIKKSNNYIGLITALIFMIGLTITAFLYQSKKVAEIDKAQNEFKAQASLRAKDIESEFMRSFFQVSSIANLFSSSTWVTHDEFNVFINSVFPIFFPLYSGSINNISKFWSATPRKPTIFPLFLIHLNSTASK